MVEKIRFQVNVRDNSVSSNEGTQTMNQLQSLFQKTGTSAGITGRLEGPNDPQRIQFDDEVSQERARDYSSSHRYDKLKAGFNVSYDSNSFQGIKNNLIMQTKAGQNLLLGKEGNESLTAGNTSHLQQAFNTNDMHGKPGSGMNTSAAQNTSMRHPGHSSFLSPFGGVPQNPSTETKNSKFQTLPHGGTDAADQLPSLNSSLQQMGPQNMYSQATRQNIKSIIQSLNNPLGQSAQGEKTAPQRRPQTQLGQSHGAASYTMAQGHLPDRHAHDRDRRDSPSSLSFDQRKKQYLSNQKQKHIPLLSKSQQY